jgi:hypothetical protein
LNRFFMLFASILILAGFAAGVRAFVGKPRPEPIPVPEPVPPVLIVDAFSLPAGGASRVQLRDSAANQYDFRVSKSDVEVFDDRHNRLILLDRRDFRVVEIGSDEEQRLRDALTMAIDHRQEQPDSDDDPRLLIARRALERFSHIGKPWPY